MLFFSVADNKFITDQIQTDTKCVDSSCSHQIKNGVCHPLGFCYCDEGTVKLDTVTPTGETVTQCVEGEGNLYH